MHEMKLPSRRIFLAGASALLASSVIDSARASERLVVIVHPKITHDLSDAELAAVFTTRKQNWSDGSRIVPFNFPAKHEVRVAFDQEILEMSPDDVARYWIDRRIRGGNPPPKQVPNGSMIVKLVQRLEGAIAYVPESNVMDGVRIARQL